LEFKEAKNQYPKDKLYEYCVAIANEGGGHLLLGIRDKAPRDIVGTHAFEDVIALTSQLFNTLGFRVDVDEVQHPEGRVVVFTIPGRPRGSVYNLQGKYLMRSGESLVPMSEDQLRRIFAEGAPDWLEETALDGLASEKVIELLDVQTYFELQARALPTSQSGILDRLIQERFVRETPSGYSISRLGGVLLAKRLEDFPDLYRKVPRVVVYEGSSKLTTRLDQVGSKGYAVGFQGLVKFVMAQVPRIEALKDALRTEGTLAPESVMRELIANALVHQDFGISGVSTMIEIYDDRVEVSNPGIPIVAIERFIDGYQSRNERLADCMRRFGICEERSSGVDRVVQWAEMHQLPAPDFRIARGPMKFSGMACDDRVRACHQHCVLRYVMNQNMTNQSLRERFGLPEAERVNALETASVGNLCIERGAQLARA